MTAQTGRRKLTVKEAQVLMACIRHNGGWLPYRGTYSTAIQLFRDGLLVECGMSVMTPHTLYAITEAGRTALAEKGAR